MVLCDFPSRIKLNLTGDAVLKDYKMLNNAIYGTALVILPLLTGCGGTSLEGKTTFSLSVSDAPVDEASKVVVCFSQVELKGGTGNLIFAVGEGANMITPNALCRDENETVIANRFGIDLLAYAGSDSFSLLENILIPAGEYSQLRLLMAEGSYVQLEDKSKIKVEVPSNELKLDGFTAAIYGVSDLTVEFDLRKGMTNPVGQDRYLLKPRAVRLVDNSESAAISGSVDAKQICSLSTPVSGDAVGSVYLYQGFDLDINELPDNNANETDSPYASTLVRYNGESYDYEVGFVASGEYSVAFSCDTEDDPEQENNITFIDKQQITLGSTDVVVNFNSTAQ